MAHIFIAPTAIFSPRWQQAFASAQVVSSMGDAGEITKNDVLWLLLDKDWLALSECVATGARVIVLTAREDPLQAQRALELGACGYVHYLAVAEVLVQVDQVVRHGGLWLGAELMRRLVSASSRRALSTETSDDGLHHSSTKDIHQPPANAPKGSLKAPLNAALNAPLNAALKAPRQTPPQNPLAELTPRENAVAKAVAAGQSNKEVARQLDITERTVKAHLSAVFTKLGVRDRLHLVLAISGRT